MLGSLSGKLPFISNFFMLAVVVFGGRWGRLKSDSFFTFHSFSSRALSFVFFIICSFPSLYPLHFLTLMLSVLCCLPFLRNSFSLPASSSARFLLVLLVLWSLFSTRFLLLAFFVFNSFILVFSVLSSLFSTNLLRLPSSSSARFVWCSLFCAPLPLVTRLYLRL